MSTLKIVKKLKILQFVIYFFDFLELKHNIKNENLENVILVRESEKSNFLCIFSSNLLQKKVILFVLHVQAKVKKNKKLEKKIVSYLFYLTTLWKKKRKHK